MTQKKPNPNLRGWGHKLHRLHLTSPNFFFALQAQNKEFGREGLILIKFDTDPDVTNEDLE